MSIPFLKNKEVINYLVFGVLTTIVNIIIFILCTTIFNINYKISTIFAWIISVIFAFFTNKLFVFNSVSFKPRIIFKELLTFVGFRLASLGVDIGMMFILIELLNFNEVFSKILANTIVVLVNYLASKLFIFKSEKKTG
ncbi:GtrA family protein [Neobacillus mesonae]|uniref:GtrA family protein n=1 Tax=Neobacillus mesonae TaxID=1193713 RepID=UPI00257327F0|nr:GtrA family protein [Neobacillus mesonae]